MIRRFLTELRRRRVLRVAGVYVVVGWGVLQAADMLAGPLGLPGWTVPLVGVLLLLGLPVTAVIAWAYQVVPDSGQPAADSGFAAGRWMDGALLVAVVVAVALSAWQISGGRNQALAPTAAATPDVAPRSNASVAVLPFTSFSDDADDNYFADGLTEELINGLVQVPGLQVPGRTSSFYFKNRNEDLREIGRQLGVAHVVEGSVRRSGGRLRVTVQLVSAADGFHLWSRTYDRELTDAFAIQQDIAAQVSANLERTLLATMPAGDDRPPSAASYPSFLIATALLRDRSLDALTQARGLFDEILQREPDNVDALAGYARATIVLAGAYLTIDFEPAANAAVEAVERALALDPDSVAANLAAGSVYRLLGFRSDEQHYYALAERALAHAVDLAPNDPDVLGTYGGLLTELARYDAAIGVIERAIARDPLDRAVRFQLAEAYRGAGRLGDAMAELEALLERDPHFTAARLELAELLVEMGQFGAALPHLQTVHADRSSPRGTFALAHLYVNLGLDEAARRTIDEIDYAPLSKPLGDMALAMMAGDSVAAQRLADAELSRTGDGIWRSLVLLTALQNGDLVSARQQLRQIDPTLLAPRPDVSRTAPQVLLLAGSLMMRESRVADATWLLEGLIERLAPPPQGFDPLANKLLRAHALAQLGRRDDVLAELTAARIQGYRALRDFDTFLRLDHYPTFAAMRDDPGLVALLDAIDAENRALGARLADLALARSD